MKPKLLPAVRRQVVLVLLAAMLMSGLAQLLTHVAATAKTTSGVKPYSSKPTKDALKWADKELRRMSLDEKIGQLICVAVNATFMNQDSDAFKAVRHQVEDNHVGGIILFRGPVYESVVLTNRMQKLARYPFII